MGFWIKNIIFGCILIVLAYLFFDNQDLLKSLGQETASPVKTTLIKDPITVSYSDHNPIKDKKIENNAANGLSKFYANINADTNVDKPTIRKNIVYLPKPRGDLELLLDTRQEVVKPYLQSWQGTVESRPFRLGETIYQKLAEYAQKENLKVFWRLNRDYVVKDAFRINKSILKLALQLGQGINGHFQNGVSIYFCYQSRSLVVIEGEKNYLNERCVLLKAS